MASPSVTLPKVLLVEGSYDEHVIEHLCRQISPSLSFGIKACGNVDRLLKSIPVEVKAPGRTVVGVLADANANIADRWQEVSEAFQEANILLPSGPMSGGVIAKSSPIRVGVWLMPDNVNRGELEDFLKALIPTDDRVWSLAQTYIDSIPSDIRPLKRSKAEVHAWLAGKPILHPPGVAMDRSEGYFDTDGPLAMNLKQWLNQLYR